MMQSLAGIDPVFACGNDVSFDSSERLATVVSFASSPNPVAAERFQLAMAFGGTVKSSWRGEFSERLNAEGERVLPEGRMSARREIFISPKHPDSVPTRRGEDASPCHDVNAAKDFPKDAVTLSAVSENLPLDRTPLEQAERMPAESAPLESYPMPGAPSGKAVSVKRSDVSSDCIRETETGGVAMDCAVEEKPPEVKGSVIGTLKSPERSESHGQFKVGSNRILLENVEPADVAKSVLPEKAVLVERDVPIASKDMYGVSLWRRGDATHGQDAVAQSTESKEVQSGQLVSTFVSVSKDMPVEHDVEAGKGAPNELRNVVGNDTRKTEVIITEVGRAVSPKPTKVNDSDVGALIFPKRSESQVQFNAGSEHVLPENVKSADVFNRVLPGKAVLVGRDGGIALQNQEGMPVRRQGDAPFYQNIGKVYEMPSDGNEPVQVIAPAPLPIELPASVAQQQAAAAVATHDVVKMFVAAVEAVADAILVSSGFENGEGRILVRLQPEVLGGSEVQITAKGGTLTVIVNPASQDVQTIVEANRTQFEQHLAEKVHSWRVAVAVRRGEKTNERV